MIVELSHIDPDRILVTPTNELAEPGVHDRKGMKITLLYKAGGRIGTLATWHHEDSLFFETMARQVLSSLGYDLSSLEKRK